jgi:hypothetical protein
VERCPREQHQQAANFLLENDGLYLRRKRALCN